MADNALDRVRIVLVSPLYGGNIGAACRAMENMGLSDLAIAAPRAVDMDEARALACHAAGILDGRREYPDLAAAVADCARVFGTTVRKGLYRQHSRSPRESAAGILETARAGRVALVFGREDNGLTNDELALCTALIRIPTADRYTSLNVAQAIMVCCYELFLATGTYEEPREKSAAASSDLRERMFAMWRDMLLRIGFMEEAKADHMMLGLRRVFGRGAVSVDDVNILMGVARQSRWAADHASAPAAPSAVVAAGETAGAGERRGDQEQ